MSKIDMIQGSQKNCNHFAGTFLGLSRTIFDFQGPPTRNIISHITVKKFSFSVHSNRTIRLELFPSPTSLHFSVHLSQINS